MSRYIPNEFNNGSLKFSRRQKQPLEVDREIRMKNRSEFFMKVKGLKEKGSLRARNLLELPLWWQVFICSCIVLYGLSIVIILLGLLGV